MLPDLDNISADAHELAKLVSALSSSVSQLTLQNEALQAAHDALNVENERLRFFIKQMQRAQFGQRSEKVDPDQLNLALEGFEQSIAKAEAAKENAEAAAAPAGSKPPRTRAKRNLGDLPSHFPRYEVVIEPEEKSCPCCSGALHVIGEDVSEQLDIVPAQFRVKVIRRPRYGCRGCEGGVVQAPAPERPIDGGMATEALLAHVVVTKYADHCPLYRQAQIYQRQGINLDRSTLANWVGRAAWWLAPLHDMVLGTVMSRPKIFADDTTVPVLAPGNGKTKTGRFWAYGSDDRPWMGQEPPAVAYIYAEDRGGRHPTEHLKEFSGILQIDGYSGYNGVGKRPNAQVTFVYCWAHTRRKFFDIHKATNSPIAAEALRRIAELYAIEAEIRGTPATNRREIRQKRSRPLVEQLKPWLRKQLEEVSGKSPIASAIRYALGHWAGLCVFLDDGRVEMDTNTIERAMRIVKLGVKNHLFAGSDGGGVIWAIFATIIETAKLNDVDPEAYLRDVLEQIVSGRCKANELRSLMPWNWNADKIANHAINPSSNHASLPVTPAKDQLLA